VLLSFAQRGELVGEGQGVTPHPILIVATTMLVVVWYGFGGSMCPAAARIISDGIAFLVCRSTGS